MPSRTTTASARIALALAGFALAASAGACIPLPIPHTEQVTPRVMGTLRRADGSPVAGATVAVTTDEHDATCTKPGGRGVTDAGGAFTLPAVHEHRNVFYFSLMENFGMMTYWLCAGGAADTATASHRPRRTIVSGFIRGDTLTCLEWVWQAETRLTCDSGRTGHVATGGAWSDARGARGSYRVIVAEEGSWGYAGRCFVQWLEERPGGGPPLVRATADLTGSARAEIPRRVQIVPWRDGHAHVTLTSVEKTKWGNEKFLRFELGAPGQFVRLPDTD